MITTSRDLPWSKIDSFIGNTSNPALTAERPCPICGSLLYRNLLEFKDFQFYSDSLDDPKRANIREVQCHSCHAVYLNPCYSVTGFKYLFGEAGQSYGASEGRPLEQVDWLGFRGLLDKDKVFLDAGCYDGRFLGNLPNNIQRIGVDIDAEAIRRAQANPKFSEIVFIHGAFEGFQCPVAPDVISMFHVLEHLSNPFDVLTHLRSISHEETRLVVEVPIIEHGKTNDINGFLSAQHMTHFSEYSLGALMRRAGWHIVESQKMTGYNGHRILAKLGQISEKVTGDVSDRSKVFEYLGYWYRNLTEVSRRIESWPKISRMVIWGGGMHSEFLYQVTSLFQQDLLREYIIVDSDSSKHGKTWRGLHILTPEIIKNIDWEGCLMLISSYGGQQSIADAATKLSVPNSCILRLYDCVDVY